MRAAQIERAGVIEIVDRAEPTLTRDTVIVSPLYVGLCGSDVSYYRSGANGTFQIREPLTIGHEIVATVTSIGESAFGDLRIGDRVLVHPVWPSPLPGGRTVPTALAAEVPHFLGSASTWPHTHGGLTERLAVRGERLRRLPDDLPSTRAALAEPLSVVLHALDRLATGYEGARVLVCGAGPIGLLAAVALRRRGVASVALTDLHERPLAIGSTLGAEVGYLIGDARNPVPEESFDIAIEATGVPASLDTAIRSLRPGATLIQLGMLAKGGITADLAQVVVKELTVIGSHRFLGELDDAIALLADAPECDVIVTDVLPLAQIDEALRRAGDAAGSSKVLVAVGG